MVVPNVPGSILLKLKIEIVQRLRVMNEISLHSILDTTYNPLEIVYNSQSTHGKDYWAESLREALTTAGCAASPNKKDTRDFALSSMKQNRKSHKSICLIKRIPFIRLQDRTLNWSFEIINILTLGLQGTNLFWLSHLVHTYFYSWLILADFPIH